VGRVLKQQGFKWVKTTKKPGLKAAMKEARLAFALKYEHWTLEDWKNVIWSDETSIILGHRRGNDRVWRRAWEKHEKSCKRNRWKGFSEFMWWSCFSWDRKGPYHIWKKETAKEKKAAQQAINARNALHEPDDKLKWEIEVMERRQGLRRPGRKPTWKYTVERGAWVHTAKAGGID
jgi:hypothetical protein